MFSIDDGRQREDHVVAVVDNGVHRAVSDDGQVGLQVRVARVKLHQLGRAVLFGLIQRYELDISWFLCHVPERSLDGVEVVSPNGGESSLAGQVLVQLVLQVDEGVVPRLKR